MNRTELLNHISRKIQAENYLEIGVNDGKNFRNIGCHYKVGVDPDPQSPATHNITSDEFFKSNEENFDLIFVDGLHHADQVERDIINSLKILNQRGVIVCHDMNPAEESHQIIPFNGGTWNGDCWRAFVKLRQERSDLVMYTVDTDYGCSIIQRGSQDLLKINQEINYENFSKNRKSWLNLISVDEFYKKFKISKLETLLYKFVDDPADPENNFQMALEYDGMGHTASAVSYYLRTAERTDIDLLRYECLIRASMCFARQGSRNFTVKGLLQHAVSIMPKRPEAYYLLSRFYENEKNDGHWNDCYMIASIGEKVADFNSPSLRTAVDYPGKYAIDFQKALSSWHCGLCDESRDLFKKLLRNPSVSDHFRHVIIGNLKWMKAYFEIPFDSYDSNKLSKFRYPFPGIERIEKNNSEAYQDMFVLSALKGKTKGTYLEIGAGAPFYGSNTALLEKEFGWKGFSIDVNELAVSAERKNPCIIKNALTIDYELLLSALDKDIDFLQVDCDPVSTTFDVLLKIPFDQYRFRVITFEHDYYNDESKSFRQKSREYLESKGYKLLVSDIAPDTLRNYEDWWVHPDLVDSDIIQTMTDIRDVVKKAEHYFLGS